MAPREYGQFCGLARAGEVLSQRWALLIIRDLMVRPSRFTDLLDGLPGIPTNILSTRLRELEADGLVVREARSQPRRDVVYRLTPRGERLESALLELGRWGAATMDRPREGEVLTEAALVTALRAGALRRSPPSSRRTKTATYEVRAAAATATAVVTRDSVRVTPGSADHPDLIITAGPGLRALLAGVMSPAEAIARGGVHVKGDSRLLKQFVASFTVPLDSR